jgi:hypothetical protein
VMTVSSTAARQAHGKILSWLRVDISSFPYARGSMCGPKPIARPGLGKVDWGLLKPFGFYLSIVIISHLSVSSS